MSKTIRSQYIKNLLADKETLSEQLKANTKDSLRSLLEDTVKDSLRGILNEEDDNEKDDINSFDVEEVNTDNPTDDTTTSEISVDTDTDTVSGDDTDDTTSVTDDITDNDTEEDDMWKGLDQFKGENGEYDLTGMDSENVIKVLKVMGPEDSVRVVKNDNGSVTLTDDETEKEYIIDIEGTMTGNDGNETATEETSFENDETPMNEENLGYTDNYQNKTAMTTPDNNEPGKNVNSWEDKAIPTGTEKPWVGNKGDMSPYNTKNVNETENECNNECGKNCIFEIELDEDPIDVDVNTSNTEPSVDEAASSVTRNNSATRGVTNSQMSSEAQKDDVRNGHHNGNKFRGTGDGYGKVNENKDQELANMVRKANAILEENKELKKIANDLRDKINEAVVINASLAKVINLVTENSTTRNEKINILERFNSVKTLDESKTLYETISRELKSAHTVNNGTKLINEQLNESKSKAAETQIYKSEDLNETIDFMRRLNKIKR